LEFDAFWIEFTDQEEEDFVLVSAIVISAVTREESSFITANCSKVHIWGYR